MKTTTKGAIIAAAVAGIFGCAHKDGGAAGTTGSTASAATVHCAGINSCKGTGACGGADHSCKGMNECKGKGWVEAASADECTGKGGTVTQ